MHKVLICIPTYNRNQSLLDCLNSIRKLKNKNYFRLNILVLDNSLENKSKKIVYDFKKKYKLKIYQAHEKRRGIVFARNKCLKISKIIKPNYLAFIDDDCQVDKNWIKNIYELLKKKEADVITGPQKYEKKNNYSHLFEKKYNDNLVEVKWAASNNVFLKFDIINDKRTAIFDKNLNKFGMGEDQLFFTAIRKLGYKIYWSKKIFVTEKVHKHRSNITWIKERSKRLGILGHYLDIKLHGKFIGYFLNYSKSIYFLFLSFFSYSNILNKNKNLYFYNYFFRSYGKIIGPFKINEIDFFK